MEPLPLLDFYHRDCYGLQLLNRGREVAPTGTYPSRTGFFRDLYRLGISIAGIVMGALTPLLSRLLSRSVIGRLILSIG